MRRVVIAAVVAVLALVGLAPVARAASVFSGPISPGTPVTLDLGPDDFADVSFPFPTGATSTVTVTAMSPGLAVQLLSANTNVVLSADDPSAWFLELGTNGGEAGENALFLANASATAGSVTFVVDTPLPLEVRVPTGTDVPVQVDTPGQRVSVTFDAGAGDRATLRLSDVVLSAALDGGTGPRFFVQPAGFPFSGDRTPERPDQVYGPGEVQQDGDSSFLVELAGGRTGSFTVHVDLEYAPGQDLSYRSDARLVTLDTATRVRQLRFTATGFVPTGVQVYDPHLTGKAGAQGSATVQLVLPGSAPVTLGTVTDAPVTFTTPEPLPQLGDATLRVVGDGATTGTLFLRIVLAPVPGAALTTGSTPLVLPAGAGARTWTFDAAEGDSYALFLQDIVFGDPSTGGTVTATVLGPAGRQVSSALLTVFSSAEQVGFTADTAGRYTLELSWDGPTGFDVSTTLLTVRMTERAVTATVPADVPVGLPDVGETLAVTLPVRAGHRLALRLVDQAWTGPADQFGNPADVSVTASSDVLGLDAFTTDDFGLSQNGDRYFQTVDAPADATVTVRIAGRGLTTGSARLLVTEPADTTGSFAATGATTIPVDTAGAVADYAFEVTQPGPAALDLAAPTLTTGGAPGGTGRVVLVTPDGTRIDNGVFDGGERLWLDLSTRGPSGLPETPTGTWHLRFDPAADATGTLVVGLVRPTVTTTAVRPGRTTTLTYAPGDLRRLTFSGRAGQRPVLRFTGDRLDVALVLVGPDGLAVRTYQSFEYRFGYAEFDPLPASGTWSVVLDPDFATAGTQNVRLDLVRDAVRTVEPGRLVTATWAVGENPVYRFAVRKGQHVAIDVRTARLSDALSSSGQAGIALFGAGTGDFTVAQARLGDGSSPTPVWVEPGEIGFTAPQDGIWEVRLGPDLATTGEVTFVVRAAADKVVTGRLGKTTTVAVDAPVQGVALPFDVSGPQTGGLLTWSVKDSTFAGARLELYSPFGTLWDFVDVPPGASSGTFFSGVGFAGTWRLVLDPTDAGTGRAKVFFGLTGTV